MAADDRERPHPVTAFLRSAPSTSDLDTAIAALRAYRESREHAFGLIAASNSIAEALKVLLSVATGEYQAGARRPFEDEERIISVLKTAIAELERKD